LQGFPIRAWRFSRDTAKSLLHDSWPLLLSSFLTMIYLRIDQIMIGNMIGSGELGNYSVAVRISEVWYFIPIVFSSSVFPAVVRAEATSEDLYYAHLQRLYNLMAFMAYTVAVPVAFFAKDIIQILFSSAYDGAGPLLAILIWTGLFTSLGAARDVFILSKNWTRVHLVSIGLGCTLNIILNIMLIPNYGTMGAVAATFVSYWFAVHGTCFFFPSLRETGLMMTKAMLYPKFWQ
jgi:O-antigen/teichoic acid export membrane protein